MAAKVKAHIPSVLILIKIFVGLRPQRENVHPENVEIFAIEINNCQTTRFRFFPLYTLQFQSVWHVKSKESSGANHKSKHMHLSRNEQFGFNYFSRFYLCAACKPLHRTRRLVLILSLSRRSLSTFRNALWVHTHNASQATNEHPKYSRRKNFSKHIMHPCGSNIFYLNLNEVNNLWHRIRILLKSLFQFGHCYSLWLSLCLSGFLTF